MNYIFSLFVSLTILASCASTKEVTEINSSGTSSAIEEVETPTDSEQKYVFEDLEKGDSLFTSIRKGYCFGTCPVYIMKVYNSGYVRLEGKANIDKIGVYSTKLSHEQMMTFVNFARRMNYMELNDVYDNIYISDLPETNTSIVLDGKRKSIKRRHGFPQSIVSFEKIFSSLLETEKWNLEKGNGDIK